MAVVAAGRGSKIICELCGFPWLQVPRHPMTLVQVNDGLTMKQWESQQNGIRKKVIRRDTEKWQRARLVARHVHLDEHDCSAPGNSSSVYAESVGSGSVLTHVAGMDVSIPKQGLMENGEAAVAVVICQMPDLQVVYQSCEFVKLSVPYMSGFLCFREGPVLTKALKALLNRNPEILPQVVLVDGNGILHPRECGLACYVGVTMDIPCIGVAKNLLHVDGIEKSDIHKEKVKSLLVRGETFPLVTNSGKVMGLAMKTGEKAERPVYISVGHKISLETAAWVVSLCSPMHRIPEPIRMADILSRELLRKVSGSHMTVDHNV